MEGSLAVGGAVSGVTFDMGDTEGEMRACGLFREDEAGLG